MYWKIRFVFFFYLYEIFWLTEVCKFNVVESITFFFYSLWVLGPYLRNQFLLFSHFSGMHTMCMLMHLMVSHVSLRLSVFIHSFFSACSGCIISIDLSSSLLILLPTWINCRDILVTFSFYFCNFFNFIMFIWIFFHHFYLYSDISIWIEISLSV